MFKKSQDEAHGGEIDVKKKSVAFKAQDSKNEEESVEALRNKIPLRYPPPRPSMLQRVLVVLNYFG